jgi:hypothetical protein
MEKIATFKVSLFVNVNMQLLFTTWLLYNFVLY